MLRDHYLRLSDRRLADASVNRCPRAGGEDTGEQWVEISCAQTPTVTLYAFHVSLYQTLPQPAVVQPEVLVQHLGQRHTLFC